MLIKPARHYDHRHRFMQFIFQIFVYDTYSHFFLLIIIQKIIKFFSQSRSCYHERYEIVITLKLD